MSNSNSNLPAKQEGLPAKTEAENLPSAARNERFLIATMEDVVAAIEGNKGRDIKNAAVSSVNMVSDYLSFDELAGIPIRRIFCGWTARPLVDFLTKEPVVDPETGEQLYGPAAIFYDPETEKMQVNQASILIGTIKERKFKPGQCLQITHTGYKKTSKGNKAQDFDIRTLE